MGPRSIPASLPSRRGPPPGVSILGPGLHGHRWAGLCPAGGHWVALSRTGPAGRRGPACADGAATLGGENDEPEHRGGPTALPTATAG